MGAFQADAFQNDAFQVPEEEEAPAPVGSSGRRHRVRRPDEPDPLDDLIALLLA